MLHAVVAGHDFQNGRCATCGRAWVDIRGATKANVGQKGWSCGENDLSEYHASQIISEREAEEKRFDAAMGHVWRAR